MGWLEKYFQDGKIVLAGDFFHTKASKISADFGIVEIPHYLGTIEESLAKVIHIESSRLLKGITRLCLEEKICIRRGITVT
jgi:hypothetical protein